MKTDIETLEEMFRTPMPETRLRRIGKHLKESLIILGSSVWLTPYSRPAEPPDGPTGRDHAGPFG
jgi:hypothetical protein